jgi:hypothetical protein
MRRVEDIARWQILHELFPSLEVAIEVFFVVLLLLVPFGLGKVGNSWILKLLLVLCFR